MPKKCKKTAVTQDEPVNIQGELSVLRHRNISKNMHRTKKMSIKKDEFLQIK